MSNESHPTLEALAPETTSSLDQVERQHGALTVAGALFSLAAVRRLLGEPSAPEAEVELPDESGVMITTSGRLLDRRGATEVQLPIERTNGGKAVWRGRSSRSSLRLANAVFEAFIGSVPPGMSIEHIDGDRLNCAVENLFLVPSRH